MSVRFDFFLLAAACSMTCSIAASAPLIEGTNGTAPAAESHAVGMYDLLADPAETLVLKAVEFVDPVVQQATRDDASLRDAVVLVASASTPASNAGSDPCPSAERSACGTEPREDRTETKTVAESASAAPETTIGAAPIALLCLGLASCLVLGLGPIVRGLSTHKQRKHWRAIKGRLASAARGH